MAWQETCTCPGAQAARERLANSSAEIARRRNQVRLAIEEITLDEKRSTKDVRADLLASYRAHGIEPHSDLNGLASVLRAMNGPAVLRLPRLVKLGVDGLRTLRQAERANARPLSYPAAEDESCDDENRIELRQAFRLYAIYGLTAVGLAAAARRTAGVARMVLYALAVLLAAVTVWSVLLVGGLDLLLRIARAHAPDLGHD